MICGWQCTTHRNPFDPENKQTKGEPYSLRAKPYFGQIILDWNPLPSELKVDDYQIYRKQGNGNWSKLASTQADSFSDKSVDSETNYSYRISAWRGQQESDLSMDIPAQAYWYPKNPDPPNGYPYVYFPDPADMTFCSFCNRRYIVCEGIESGVVVVLDDHELRVSSFVPVGGLPKGIAVWHNAMTQRDSLLVCNWGDLNLSVIAEETVNEFRNIGTIPPAGQRLEGRPSSVQISSSLRMAFVAVDGANVIRRIDLNKRELMKDGWRVSGSLKKLFLVGDSDLLLGLNQNDDEVVGVDFKSGVEKFSIPVGDEPRDLAVVPGRNLAYVACYNALTISVINFMTLSREPHREMEIPKGVWEENHPLSVAVDTTGPDDGLLFVAVHAKKIGQNATRALGYHIGANIKNLIDEEEIFNAVPRLTRRPANLVEKKLYVLHSQGLHTYF
jgi:DNA-binding beta-propeller fold protein YncE